MEDNVKEKVFHFFKNSSEFFFLFGSGLNS